MLAFGVNYRTPNGPQLAVVIAHNIEVGAKIAAQKFGHDKVLAVHEIGPIANIEGVENA